jgi:hypothetical protein
MTRIFKALFVYCGLSLLFAPLSILSILPNIPSSLLGWLVVLVLPVPFAVASEWLCQRLDNTSLPLMDSFGSSIERSPYRLLLTVTLVATAGGCGLGAVWLLSLIT